MYPGDTRPSAQQSPRAKGPWPGGLWRFWPLASLRVGSQSRWLCSPPRASPPAKIATTNCILSRSLVSKGPNIAGLDPAPANLLPSLTLERTSGTATFAGTGQGLTASAPWAGQPLLFWRLTNQLESGPGKLSFARAAFPAPHFAPARKRAPLPPGHGQVNKNVQPSGTQTARPRTPLASGGAFLWPVGKDAGQPAWSAGACPFALR